MGGDRLDKWEYFSNGQNKGDPCHPNNLGYSVIAGMVYRHLFAMENPFNNDIKEQVESKIMIIGNEEKNIDNNEEKNEKLENILKEKKNKKSLIK